MGYEPFLGEIQIWPINFAPKGWALCNGQLLAINQNQALFSLLGTYYGGNGQTNFALPDFRGRMPLHFGTQPGGPNYVLGQMGGETSHALTAAELPAHTHALTGISGSAASTLPGGNLLAGAPAYVTTAPDTSLSAASVSSVGGGQPHNNMPPALTLNFIIALQGIFPSRN
ncbi:phage tail protein [Deinococcus radiotolerans]|uniref:Tail Collar domain-containing protein n=1 Tax=Deinococcus radiotolerans TaxID=1309407 RepID=A0ABQ2FRI3_9DEIO|nr:tail fiber protein [Deinococcus radiotolerans]GGL19750.1 tail Collar domain-containing protein [Deinococcus radiotolerans]